MGTRNDLTSAPAGRELPFVDRRRRFGRRPGGGVSARPAERSADSRSRRQSSRESRSAVRRRSAACCRRSTRWARTRKNKEEISQTQSRGRGSRSRRHRACAGGPSERERHRRLSVSDRSCDSRCSAGTNWAALRRADAQVAQAEADYQAAQQDLIAAHGAALLRRARRAGHASTPRRRRSRRSRASSNRPTSVSKSA